MHNHHDDDLIDRYLQTAEKIRTSRTVTLFIIIGLVLCILGILILPTASAHCL